MIAMVEARAAEWNEMENKELEMEESRGRQLDAYKGGWPAALGDALCGERNSNKEVRDELMKEICGHSGDGINNEITAETVPERFGQWMTEDEQDGD